MKRPWVFFSPGKGLSPEELHHLKVLRVRDGDEVVGFDGKGGVFLCIFKGNGLEVLEEFREDRPFSLRLVFPLLKSQKVEFTVKSSPSFDVEKIYLFPADRAEVRKPPDGGKMERWRKIAIEGCKQSRNPYIPELVLLKELKELPPSQVSILLDEEERERGILDVSIKGSVSVAVGPEGGFTERERKVLMGKGFIPVSLGRRILTSELAAISSLFLCSLLLGKGLMRRDYESWFFRLSRHKGI